MSPKTLMACGCLEVLLIGCPAPVFPQGAGNAKRMDARVEKFLNENRSNWHDWNAPYEDGKVAVNFQYRLTGREGLSEKMGLMERPFSFYGMEEGGGRLRRLASDRPCFLSHLFNQSQRSCFADVPAGARDQLTWAYQDFDKQNPF
jgi:hypothetical protein